VAVKSIRDILIADPSVVSIVGADDQARISPLMRPQDEALPSVVITEAVEALNTLTGTAGIDHCTYTVDSYATTYAGAHELAGVCRAAVEAAGGLMISEQDNFDASAELSGICSVTQDFSLWI
jgi:hypothetical protein